MPLESAPFFLPDHPVDIGRQLLGGEVLMPDGKELGHGSLLTLTGQDA